MARQTWALLVSLTHTPTKESHNFKCSWGNSAMTTSSLSLCMSYLKNCNFTWVFPKKPFLSNIEYHLKYVESNWLTSLWNVTNYIKATIHIEDAWELQPQRTYDKCIMDIFHSKHLNLQPKELKQLNACRLFLQVITVADLTDGSGTKIIVDYLQ
jgi:hypothetical protein